MPPLMQLPAYQVPGNALVNFQPISDAIDSNRANALAQQKMGMEQERLGMERKRLGMAEQSHARSQQDAERKRLGNMALLALQEDEAKQAAVHQQLLSSHPNAAGLPAHYKDPRTGLLAIVGDAGLAEEYLRAQVQKQAAARAAAAESRAAELHPLHVKEAQLGLEAKQRDLKDPAGKLTTIPEGGTLVATDPRSGAHKVIAQGQPKIDATTRREIVEADDAVSGAQNVISNINRALELNAQSYSGWLARGRADVVNNTVGSREAANTTELDNVVTQQALQGLKATFGGNPTEGERKIMLEVQGSVNQPREVRERILKEAKRLAEVRLAYNRERATAMRGGSYFKQGGQPQALQEPSANANSPQPSAGEWSARRLD